MGILDSLSTTDWTPFGPAPISAPGVGLGLAAGRVEAAAPHPTHAGTMYIAASDGGAWKTTQWTSNPPGWEALGDTQQSLQYSGYRPLVVHPAQPSLVLGVVSYHGAGLLKSTNGGTSWTLYGNGPSGSFPGFEGAAIGSIAVDPQHTDILYVSVWSGGPGGGVWVSTDGGANWTNTTAFHTGGVTDVAIAPDGKTLYAGLIGGSGTAGIYKSTDGALSSGTASWKLQAGLPTGSSLNAVRVAVGSTGNVAYVACLTTSGSTTTVHRYKTTNGGTSWPALAATPGTTETRSWHFVLGLDPKSDQHVLVNDAYALYESTNGGQSWSRADTNNGADIGDDWVNVAFDADDAVVATADRTLYRYHPNNKTWKSKEGNLQLTLLYDIALDPYAQTMYAVAQDHPWAMKFTGNLEWAYMEGGGGETGKPLVDPNDTSRVYLSNPLDPNNFVARSTDGGQHWTPIFSTTSFNSGDYGLAYAAQKSFVMDPSNPKRLYIGTTKVWSTSDATAASPSWSAVSGVLTSSTSASEQYLTALAVAPSDHKTIYAATADGHVWMTSNGGTSWPAHDSGLFGGTILDIRVDTANAGRAVAVGRASGSVWYLDPATATWKQISGDLPTYVTPTTIVADWRYSTPALYLGTDRGVYHSVDLGVHWELFGNGMPNTYVSDLESVTMKGNINQVFHGPESLIAATEGRGAWAILTRASSIWGNILHYVAGPAHVNPGDPVEGIIVQLESSGTVIQRAVTDRRGHYRFDKVAPGNYTLRRIAPAGYVADDPSTRSIAVRGGELGRVDFHYRFDAARTAAQGRVERETI